MRSFVTTTVFTSSRAICEEHAQRTDGRESSGRWGGGYFAMSSAVITQVYISIKNVLKNIKKGNTTFKKYILKKLLLLLAKSKNIP